MVEMLTEEETRLARDLIRRGCENWNRSVRSLAELLDALKFDVGTRAYEPLNRDDVQNRGSRAKWLEHRMFTGKRISVEHAFKLYEIAGFLNCINTDRDDYNALFKAIAGHGLDPNGNPKMVLLQGEASIAAQALARRVATIKGCNSERIQRELAIVFKRFFAEYEFEPMSHGDDEQIRMAAEENNRRKFANAIGATRMKGLMADSDRKGVMPIYWGRSSVRLKDEKKTRGVIDAWLQAESTIEKGAK